MNFRFIAFYKDLVRNGCPGGKMDLVDMILRIIASAEVGFFIVGYKEFCFPGAVLGNNVHSKKINSVF